MLGDRRLKARSGTLSTNDMETEDTSVVGTRSKDTVRTIGNCYARGVGIRHIRGEQMMVTCHVISGTGVDDPF